MNAASTLTRPTPDLSRHAHRHHPAAEDGRAGMVAPSRSLEQRMRALQRANDIRSRRAQLKRDLKAGRGDMLALIVDPPEYIETMKLFDLILATPNWGRVKVNKILGQARVSPSKTVGGLSDRQRGEISQLVKRSNLYRVQRQESGR